MRRNLIIGGVIFAAFLVAVAVFLVPLAVDPNRDKAIDTVRNAGVPASITPGPGGTR